MDIQGKFLTKKLIKVYKQTKKLKGMYLELTMLVIETCNSIWYFIEIYFYCNIKILCAKVSHEWKSSDKIISWHFQLEFGNRPSRVIKL